MNTLPDKPSELIRLALSDLKKCEEDDRYGINMGVWMKVTGDGECLVCLAGSVMAQTLNTPWPSETAYLRSVSPCEVAGHEKLVALNRFRAGEIYSGLRVMGINEAGWPRRQCHEGGDLPKLYRDMNQLADDFEAAGL